MKRLFMASVALLFLSTNAPARIDESAEQCAKRYGEAISRGKNSSTHRKAGYVIRIKFSKRKVYEISFQKTGKDSQENPEEIKLNEVEALLRTNGQGKLWLKTELNKWETTDGALMAVYKDKSLTISVAEILLRIKDPFHVEEPPQKYDGGIKRRRAR